MIIISTKDFIHIFHYRLAQNKTQKLSIINFD